ncbi:MAG: endonuclease domain-containing protein [Planctomycetes bacterium]|nr:endonuclease domain-containing protein [Planctomycetota bacterium]
MIYYNPKFKKLACQLRKTGTLSEILLWQKLKQRQMLGYDFHRQKPIDEYIVDFFCPCLKLIIEIDGESHSGKTDEDEIRQRKLESLGFSVLRFLDIDMKKNIEGVLSTIEGKIREITHPNPLSRGEYS